jgi:pimeloyl-ACP methyl ester carboxylesterase
MKRSFLMSLAAVAVAAPFLLPAAAAAAASPSAGTSPASALRTAAAALQVPHITWSGCPAAQPGDPSLAGFQCARIAVPLNYSDPAGRKIYLGLVKHPARTPGKRIGTLFFNPGGPGGLGSVFLPGLLKGFGARVLDRFDIVSWDPRGMGGLSSPVVQCFNTAAQEEALIAPVDFPPLTSVQQIRWTRIHARLNRHCAGRDDALLAHVSTADNARDLDLMRRAVGESKLYYYGTSYGTFLGATYANMFPGHVRAMVLDGAIYPRAWTGVGPLGTFLRAGSDKATAATLDAFLSLCGQATGKQCAFSDGSAAATRKKYAALLARAAKSPIVIGSGQPDISESSVIALTDGNLYLVHPVTGFTEFEGWAGLADDLQTLWTASSTATRPADSTATARKVTAAATAAPKQVYAGVETLLSVVCGESLNPGTIRANIRQASISRGRAGLGGQIWPWTAYCVDWPVKAASPYLGPWNHHTSPIVVVGTTGDPATPYNNAVRTARLLPGARLITIKGYGHTELANPSTCAQKHIARYFVNGVLPGTGATCKQNTPPFR